METEVKVFHSEISRVDCEEESHLYSLLKIEPAEPILQRSLCTKNEAWEFKPKEKLYLPKRVQSHLKVKTVGDVRALFEKELYISLTNDLVIQQHYLLRKICDGSASDESTRNTAIRVLNSHKPISRSSWQMISNINPERHNHSKQYVSWNGKCIQVNGSKGGKNKFICKHDLKNIVNKSMKNLPNFKKPILKSKIGLLRNSLNVKFKPGPLQKKKFLDTSHHKYQMGNIQVVKLPTPLLEVSPTYGTILESTISSFVNSLRGVDGVINEKLAEFAVSVLGTVHDNTVTQIDKNCSITFNLNYMCEQSRLLMRRNIEESTSYTKSKTNPNVNFRVPLKDGCTETVSNDSFVEIKQIMNEILDSVDISLNQDSKYFKEDDPRDIMADDAKDLITSKDKSKRKYCELDKLDVTIINLPESSNTDYTKPCGKSFCTMGCVCESLNCVFSLKQHCGVLSCMFGCKCELSKYKTIGLLEDNCSDLIPGLLNLDNEINSHLAKEEQKFHQTVIFSGKKRIILKSRKRSWKSSKRYAEFYSKINLKGDEKIKKILTVDIEKLSCENIEPWCMVHNLYKCFCEGKFIETYIRRDETTKIQHEIHTTTSISDSTKVQPDSCELSVLRPRLRKTYGNLRTDGVLKYRPQANVDDEDELGVACARTIGYHGRKYTEDYYFATNKKIAEMEKNDSSLKNKMLRLINGKNISSTCQTTEICSESLNSELSANESGENTYDSNNSMVNETEDESKDIPNKSVNGSSHELSDKMTNKKEEIDLANAEHKGSLKNWLESSYKTYKERLLKGLFKNCLEAPKKGKAVLQSWDFILSRYRERKNIFIVSKQKPFRTFLAVDNSHPLLANCINIDDIRFADLPKYPMIVRNLVTNVTDAENVFCILRGWDHCWELIGSAVKVIEQSAGSLTDDMNFFDTHDLMNKDYLSDTGNDDSFDRNCEHVPEKVQEAKVYNEVEHSMEQRHSRTSEKSKWFELTIENDFTEIQFYKKGFYVTYEGIQRSINLARISGKTVRLSSKARTDNMQSTSQPYGIYAIPCTSQSRVFIGPYEVDEPLGIEVVKTVLDTRKQKKTRGVWITTNKLDDKNVIDNPLAYLPSANKEIQSENIPIAKSGIISSPTPTTENERENVTIITPEKDKSILKQIKPIKIRRTNGFYHFSSNNVLQKIARPDLSTNKNINEMLKMSDDSKETTKHSCISKVQSIQKFVPRKNYAAESSPSTSNIKPVAEIAPQIKITHVYSEESLQNKVASKKKGAMHILKPEEINKTVTLDGLNDDIEKFLETSKICIAPQEEILVISDGEDDVVTPCNDVWIQCCNVQNFGYLRAKTMNDNNDTRISFEFPGFKYSEFYKEDEAFEKINQVLARKMFIPKNVKLRWQVTPQKQNLTSKMLTSQCLADKKYLLIKLREQQDKKKSLLKAFTSTTLKKIIKEAPNILGQAPKSTVAKKRMKKKTIPPVIDDVAVDTTNTRKEQIKFIQGLELTSRELEKESAVLWNEAVTKRDEIYGSLVVPDNLKLQMTAALQGIMYLND